MNRFYLMLLPLMAVFSLASCSGNIDPEDQPSDAAAPYTLSVDKSEIESDGADMAIFTITDAKGNILTDADHIRNTSFQIVETGEWRSGKGTDEAPNTFSTIVDGTYTVKAMYDGVYCDNEVKVTSRNRRKYEKFHKNVLIYRFTATNCQYCPYMTTALNNVNEHTRNHSLIVQIHGRNDEFTLSATASYANDIFNTEGFPYCVYSLVEGSLKRTVNDIQRSVSNVLYTYPARTGIKASSRLEGGMLKVDAAVQASVAGEYDLALAIIRDGCIPIKDTEAYEDVYDNVLVGVSANYRAMSDASFSLEADAEKEVVMEVPADALAEVADDCTLVLFTLMKPDGKKVVIDNAVSLPLNGSVDYKYN